MKQTPNLLTCPGVPELPAPKGGDLKFPPKPEQPKLEKTYGRKRKWIKWTVLAIVAFLIILLAQPVIALGRAGFAAYEAKQALDSLKYGLQTGDYARAVNEAGRAKRSMEDVRQALQGVGFLRDFPFIGTQIRAIQDVSAVAVSSFDSAEDLLNVASGMAGAVRTGQETLGQTDVGIPSNRSWQELSVSEKRDLMRVLQQSLPEIRLARDKIDMALALWDAVPKGRMLPIVTKALSPLADMLPVLRQAMDQSVPLLETAIPLAGYPTPKQYLVILQNSDEMRPSGGFIGSIANVTLDSGDVKNFIFSDVYNIDNPVSGVWKEVPPEPLSKNLGIKAWFMRDANWSPDFVESASRVLDFYKREMELQGKPDKPDGVIAIEPGFFRELLRLTGPIEIQGKSYEDRNFMDLIEYQVEMGYQQQGVKLEDRKAVLGALGAELMKKIQAMPKSDWPKLINLVTQALGEKQIMIYTSDPGLQSSIDRLGWSGRIKPTVCDFAMIADANLAALKTDGKMVKSASYELDARDPQKPIATVTLNYRNTTVRSDWRYTRYRSYTRFYAPEGSQFISSQGAMAGDLLQTGGKFMPGKIDVMKELGKTVFGAFWAIEPGKTGQLSFTYALPQSVSDCIVNNKYVLDWQKQPGADGTELNIRILMPNTVKTADPAEPDLKWGDAVYEAQTDSQVDRSFNVKY